MKIKSKFLSKHIYAAIAVFILWASCTVASGQERNMSIGRLHKAEDQVLALIRQGLQVNKYAPDSAISLYRSALSESRRLGYSRGMAYALINLGSCLYNYKEQYQESKAAFTECLPYCYLGAADDRSLFPQIFNNLGLLHFTEGYYDSAIHWYHKAIMSINKDNIKDTGLLLSVYANMASALIAAGQVDQALYYVQQYNKTPVAWKDSAAQAQKYYSTGVIYYRKKNIDSATYYWGLSADLYKGLNNWSRVQMNYTALGTMHSLEGDQQKAKLYFDSAIAASPSTARQNLHLQQGLGSIYINSGHYQLAIRYYKRSLVIAGQQGKRNEQIYAYWALAESYAKTGHNDLAYLYQRKHSQLLDTIRDKEIATIISRTEAQFRTKEISKELKQQKLLLHIKESQLREKNLWIGGIVLCGGLLVLLLINFYRNRQKLQKEKMAFIERNMEVRRLRSIMEAEEEERKRIARDLHDGVGVLLSAAIMNYATLGRKTGTVPLAGTETYQEGLDILQEMRKEIRTIAHNLVPELAYHRDLVKAIEVLISRMKQDGNVKIELHLYGQATILEPKQNDAVYRMIEELVHNVIKHAEATQLVIQLMFHDDRLNVIVSDNGKGFDTSAVSYGMGLQNLHNRTEKLLGHLSIVSHKGKGTTVELEVPYEEANRAREKVEAEREPDQKE